MFEEFLKSEEFDTDALLDDMDMYVSDNGSSNICKETKNVNLMRQIIKYIRYQKRMFLEIILFSIPNTHTHTHSPKYVVQHRICVLVLALLCADTK